MAIHVSCCVSIFIRSVLDVSGSGMFEVKKNHRDFYFLLVRKGKKNLMLRGNFATDVKQDIMEI